jgi:hypothetical protein
MIVATDITKLFPKTNAQFITIVTSTDVNKKMKKRNNPFQDHTITKRSRVNGIVNFRYQNSVNNQRKRESGSEDFESFPRKWGKHIIGTPLIEHKDNKYLEMKVERVFDTTYFKDGKEMTSEEVTELKQYFYASGKSRQGVEKEVILRDYRLDSIEEIHANNNVLTK